MDRLYALIEKAGRRERALASLLFGALGALGMAPYNAWPVLLCCFSVFYVILDRTNSAKGALLYGWLFGFGYFFTGLFWVKNALLVEGNDFSWVWPLAVAGLPSLLACFTAWGAWASKKFANPKTVPGFLSFTAFIATAEWMRGFVFTGFPWNLFGYTWAGTLPMIQNVAIGNIYFLTWLTIFWFALPGFVFLREPVKKGKIVLGIFALCSFALCLAFGFWRLQTTPSEDKPGYALHIVQPNIPQSEKWDREKIAVHFKRLVELSSPSGPPAEKTLIVWPETALSYWLSQDSNAMQFLAATLRSYPGEAVLLTGMLRFDPPTKTYHNSLVMIDRDGNISNIYDKHHLVPFGEYIPFQKWIPLKPVVEFTGFTLGDGAHTFEALGIKYSPVICYEIIFSGAVTGPDSPDLIVNVTNDAWYGVSAGPYQHFTQAVFRAVEEGIPVIRAANTGISGVIDPLGRVRDSSPLFHEYEKKLALPMKNMLLNNHKKFKNLIFIGLVLLITSFGYLQAIRK